MNFKKILCVLTLNCVLVAGVSSIIQPKVVHAAEVYPITTNTPTEYTQNDTVGKNAIDIIEQNYLKQNENGTFYILDEAYDVIDAEAVDFLKSKMAEINTLILSNTIKFEVKNANGQVDVKVIEDNSSRTLNNGIQKSFARASATSNGSILSNYSYCSNYTWYWWGYNTIVNKDGCAMLKNNLTAELAAQGAGAALIGFIPFVGAANAAALMFGAAITYLPAINQLENAQTTGRARVVGLGAPSSGQIWDVEAIY
ncbi:hypothetical protein [Clostridium intestinale]|uniref:hypothetical protein n=1 Tax=Clostridium intestinale TaxID=36845 RepID=UPI002DD6189A|nr:hypothetical protein [Clostridium intestinale]WRY50721.1 hypothetical protein P8F83_18945 [Clostridium intestinale]